MKTLQQAQEQSKKLSTDYEELTSREKQKLDRIIEAEKRIRWIIKTDSFLKQRPTQPN